MTKETEKAEKVEQLEQTGKTIKGLIKEISQKRSIHKYFEENPARATALGILIGFLALFFSVRLIKLLLSGAAVVIRIAVLAYTVKNALRFLPKIRKKKRA